MTAELAAAATLLVAEADVEVEFFLDLPSNAGPEVAA